jgi:hypothetical protein
MRNRTSSGSSAGLPVSAKPRRVLHPEHHKKPPFEPESSLGIASAAPDPKIPASGAISAYIAPEHNDCQAETREGETPVYTRFSKTAP